VILNYLSVAVVALAVDVGRFFGWSTLPVILILSGAVVLGIITFMRVFWRTRLWKVTHAGFGALDERQIQVVYESLRTSYWIFTVVCVVILYVNSVMEKGHVSVLVAGSVLYLAHTLPAAVVAWTEKEVLRTE
jgi:hypothetical protein